MILGVDVSSFQPRIDWRQLRIDGYEFFYARCVEGVTPDKTHDTHLVNGRAADLRGGSYAFGHPSMDVEDCVAAFLGRASLVKGQLRPVIDMETLTKGPDGVLRVPDNAAAWTDAWCEHVKAALVAMFPDSFGARRGPLVYASQSYWQTMCTMRPSLGGPLGWDWWNAAYESGVGVANFADLKRPPHPTGLPFVAWQWAGNVPMKGQQGLWDCDVIYDGDEGLDRLRL